MHGDKHLGSPASDRSPVKHTQHTKCITDICLSQTHTVTHALYILSPYLPMMVAFLDSSCCPLESKKGEINMAMTMKS